MLRWKSEVTREDRIRNECVKSSIGEYNYMMTAGVCLDDVEKRHK